MGKKNVDFVEKKKISMENLQQNIEDFLDKIKNEINNENS